MKGLFSFACATDILLAPKFPDIIYNPRHLPVCIYIYITQNALLSYKSAVLDEGALSIQLSAALIASKLNLCGNNIKQFNNIKHR